MPSDVDVKVVRQDLLDEQAALDTVVGALRDEQWALATASPRWTVADQIGHVAYFDRAAAMAIGDPPRFASHRDELVGAFGDARSVDQATLGGFRAMTPHELLDAWRSARAELATAADALTDDTRVEWYGPSMGSKSFLTARLMEVWAHGQDVVDTVGARRPATDRLRHIAQLGVITRRWSYAVRGMTPPVGDVRVELVAPSGAEWQWGPDDAPGRIAGPGEDFCLVVTQRRHLDDTRLTTRGEAARDWLLLAQAFAGAATTGPPAETRS